MKKKPLGALLLAVFLTAGGCGADTGNRSGIPGGAENGSGTGDFIELTFYNADASEDSWGDPVALALTEATGVKLKTDYPISPTEQDVELMIAERNYPDMIYAKGDAGSLIEAGALIDLTELIEQYGPNIRKMYGEEFDKLRYSREDPSIYQLSAYPVGGSIYKNTGTAQIQWAVLKENDYKIPKDTAEFEQMIRNYLEAHPATEDGLERIGLTLSVTDWHWMITLGNPAGYIAEGAPDNGQWLVDGDCNAMYKFRSEKVREYFKWLNRLYHDGILDHDFATQTHEDYIAKIASGRVIALLDTDWDYIDGEKGLISDGRLDLTYAGLPLTMDEHTKAALLMDRGLISGQGVGITTACKEPEAAIRFLDYICSDEGQVLVNWGIRDVNYFIDEEGHRYRTAEEVARGDSETDYSKNTGVSFHAYPFPTYGNGVVDSTGSTYTPQSKESVMASYNEEQRAACRKWGVELLVDIYPQADEFETPGYSPVWAYARPAELDEIEKRLDEIAWSRLVSCIIGAEADFDAGYDSMIGELREAGMERAEAMLTELVKERKALAE